ncbi:MAG: hypothetical protein ACK4EX_00380 [Thermaurantimonas sp.]|uniref:hypothetical protein n=1 Tax=Thermaurantimonas sp. TaxID=2681568 RepID=UPI00391C2396
MKRRLSASFVILLFFSFQVFSQSEKVKVILKSNSIAIGQSFDLIFQLPKSERIIYPEFSDTLSGFYFLSKWDTLLIDSNNIFTKLNAVLFDTGVFTLQPLIFLIDSNKLFSDPVTVHVFIPPLNDEVEIYDIKENISFYDNRWILWISLIVVTVILLFILIKYLPKRENTIDKEEMPQISLEDQIIKSIKEYSNIYEKNGMQSSEFFFKIDSLIREYLEKKYNQPFLESTTSEILSLISSLPLSIYYNEMLKQFFKYSEMIKFAKASDNRVKTQETIQNLLLFIQSQKQNPFIIQTQKN